MERSYLLHIEREAPKDLAPKDLAPKDLAPSHIFISKLNTMKTESKVFNYKYNILCHLTDLEKI